jgi:hypothetical protein
MTQNRIFKNRTSCALIVEPSSPLQTVLVYVSSNESAYTYHEIADQVEQV